MPQDFYPQRIVCLTEETCETLYLLGQQDRIVGISGFTVRPPQARKEKPRVSAFTSAKIDRIVELKPDLVIGFSDLQADIAASLVRKGINTLIFNQRSVVEIMAMMQQLGSLVGAAEQAATLLAGLQADLQQMQAASDGLPRPVIYFEEWNEPLITGIRWVAELIEIAGGTECFPELSLEPMAKQRILADSSVVIPRQPDIIIGSWCGKKFRPEQVAARPGWQEIPAVRDQQLFEIKSPNILQPGPAALTDGVQQIHQIVQNWRALKQDNNP